MKILKFALLIVSKLIVACIAVPRRLSILAGQMQNGWISFVLQTVFEDYTLPSTQYWYMRRAYDCAREWHPSRRYFVKRRRREKVGCT